MKKGVVAKASVVRSVVEASRKGSLRASVEANFGLKEGRHLWAVSNLPNQVFQFSYFVDSVLCFLAKKSETREGVSDMEWSCLYELMEIGSRLATEMAQRNRLVYYEGLSSRVTVTALPQVQKEFVVARGECFERLRRELSKKAPLSSRIAAIRLRKDAIDYVMALPDGGPWPDLPASKIVRRPVTLAQARGRKILVTR